MLRRPGGVRLRFLATVGVTVRGLGRSSALQVRVEMLPDAFGCAVANRFGDLLDDDADPFDLLSEAEKVRERRKKKEEEEKRAKLKKAGQKESQKDRRLPRSTPGSDPVPGRSPSPQTGWIQSDLLKSRIRIK